MTKAFRPAAIALAASYLLLAQDYRARIQKPNAALRRAVARTEVFVRDELGDARSMSLDSPKSRQGRIEALRQGRPLVS